jgi:hypothetical protein
MSRPPENVCIFGIFRRKIVCSNVFLYQNQLFAAKQQFTEAVTIPGGSGKERLSPGVRAHCQRRLVATAIYRTVDLTQKGRFAYARRPFFVIAQADALRWSPE